MGNMDVHRAPAKRWGGCCGRKETEKRRGGCCGRNPADIAAELEALKMSEKCDGKKLAKMERKLEKTKEKMRKKMERKTKREGTMRNNAVPVTIC